MRSRFVRSARGYSLIEMLVVVAIIGILSLIAVPAFMNYQRQGLFRTALRNFLTDMRTARQLAISQAYDVRVLIDTGESSLKRYQFFWSRDDGTTWAPLAMAGGTGPGKNIKFLPGTVWVASTTNLSTISGNANNMVLHPSGGVTIENGATSATIVMRTRWKKIAFDRFTVTVSPSGQFKAAGDHT